MTIRLFGRAITIAFAMTTVALNAFAFEITVPHGKLTRSGVVVFEERGGVFFMEAENGEFWRCANLGGLPHVKPGDLVTVSGEVLHQTVNNRLDYCSVTVTGRDEKRIPDPDSVSVAQLNAHPVYGTKEPDRFAHIVSVAGRVMDVNRRTDTVQLVIVDEGASVSVNYSMSADKPLAKGLSIGAIVRVKGVYVYITEPRSSPHPILTGISSPLIMLASDADLTVLTMPPFWTPFRVWFAISILATFLLILFLWGVSLRRTVARQVDVIRIAIEDRAAADGARRERLRLAHDLHDDFQQLLASVSFRLLAVKNLLRDGADANAVIEQVSLAADSVERTQAGLRTVLWSMSEESEGPSRLTSLFRYSAERMAHWNDVVRFETEGEERPIARKFAGALLMILQEAVGNALKHGEATDVLVKLRFSSKSLEMSITDNGKGFDDIGFGKGHLGLRSMRGRAEQMSGKLSLKSVKGKGTTVIVRIPI